MSVGVFVHGSIQSSGLLVHGNKSYADLFKTSHSLPRGKAIVGKVDLLVGSSLPLSSIRMIELVLLDDRVGIVSPSVERVERDERVVLRNGSGSSCSPILDVDSDVQVQGPERPLSDSQSELRPIADSSWAN
ncbi:hypothetical protein LWI29_002128 [Acer saccharum]|uniref:Uncharacterized protein n=1 Tax=Acer saccharum TaxID=4024 RepID=A0AA39RNL7_ACESA|nr:hypothetical protein LWI29_002128 [Acer saccharum]